MHDAILEGRAATAHLFESSLVLEGLIAEGSSQPQLNEISRFLWFSVPHHHQECLNNVLETLLDSGRPSQPPSIDSLQENNCVVDFLRAMGMANWVLMP